MFFLLRPASPLRTPDTLMRSWEVFQRVPADSLRAVQRLSEHQGGIWEIAFPYMTPLKPLSDAGFVDVVFIHKRTELPSNLTLFGKYVAVVSMKSTTTKL